VRGCAFLVPDHPLIEAKLQFVQERGDPFKQYALPTVIL
jgi:hypothetical protein